jgi:hypothetical protein
MREKSHAVQIEPDVNMDAKNIAPNCGWSGCPEKPEFFVAHPILEWVQTCRHCTLVFLASEVEDKTEEYRGSFWGLQNED